MTNYLDLNEDINKERGLSQKLKNDYLYYKRTGKERNLNKIKIIKDAIKRGVSIH
jgi:hypothetical protein